MTPVVSRPPSKNQLLASLSPADRGILQSYLQPHSLELRFTLEVPNKPISHVYFIEEGIASVVAVGEQQRIEIGIIGPEGMSGLTVVMGNHRSPHHTYMQAAGSALRIGVPDLREAMDASTSMRVQFLKYAQAFMIQTAHTAIANGRANVTQRLARWILMSHDRLAGNRLPLTHEFLSLMLGVRRAGVTEAVHTLVGKKLVSAQRGSITVLDRKGLEKIAGGYYGLPEAELKRLTRVS
jgi:CRP-like cAMP-binding protein